MTRIEPFRKSLIVLGALALTVSAVGFIAPLFVKADRFRPEIESKLTQALGHPVSIESGIDFRLLPSPAVTLRGVKVKAPKGAADPDLLDLRKARVELSLLKMAQGRIAFQAILLDGATVTLETMADGSPSWLPTTSVAPAQALPPKQEGKDASSSQDKGQAPSVEINHLQVSNATVIVKDARTQAMQKFDGIGLDAEAGSLTGPYKFEGQANFLGQPVLLSGGLEELRRDRASPLNIEFTLPGPGFKARYGGLLSLLSGGYAARGKLVVEAPSLDGLARSLGVAQGLAPDPLRIESTLAASANTISLDETRIELAGGKGYGKLKLVLGAESRLEARLEMDRLDLDRLTPKGAQPQATAQPVARTTGGAEKAGPSDKPQETAKTPSAKTVQLPGNLAAIFDLRVGSVAWNGQSIEQVHFDAALNAGELTVSQASLQLPGGGEAAFFGFVNNVPQGLKFEGNLEAQTPKLRATLAWLGGEPKNLAANRLQNFRLKASVQGTSQEVRLTNLDMTLDETRLLGAAILKPGVRPAVGLALDLNRLDLDSYLASQPVSQQTEKESASTSSSPVAKGAAPPAASKAQISPLAFLTGFDANIRLTANNVVWKKTAANKILIDGSLLNGDLMMKDAGVGDLAGSNLRLKGGIEGLSKGLPSFKKLSLELASRQPALLAAIAGLSASGLDDLGPLALTAMLDGGVDGLDLSALLSAKGADARLDGKIHDIVSLSPRFDGKMSLKHPNAAQLLKQDGHWGPLDLASSLSADPAKIDLSNLALLLGKGKVEGGAQILLTGARPQLTAKLTGGEIDLDAYMPRKMAALGRHGMPLPEKIGVQLAALAQGGGARWSSSPIDLSGLKDIDAKADISLAGLRVSGIRMLKPVASAELRDGVLTVSKLTATLWGGALDAQARLVAGAGMQVESKATLVGADLKSTLSELAGLHQAAGKYDAQFSLTSSGRSEAELVSHLTGNGGFAAKDGVVEGIDLPAVNRQLANINNVAALAGLASTVSGGGKTAFSQMSASFKANNGIVTSNDIKLVADGGTGSGTMQADLPQWTQDAKLAFKLTGSANGPSLGVRLQGPLDAPRKFVDIDDLQRWAVEKGLMKGLKAKGLDGLLGGGSAPQQQAPSSPSADQPAQQPAQKEKPSKILKNILKGL
ncbi:MAG: AsmA family protein [Alphaproteobacteria bacterium]|nr:AsmA family protein [Alphaproteobacteria bacterium]